jgi:AcrR family transcriptional regulator
MLPFYVRDTDPPAKREILRAAIKLFGQHGLAATTIRDIAKESGYTNPALYKHFVSKEALALYLFETSHRRLGAAVTQPWRARRISSESWRPTSEKSRRSSTSTRRRWRFSPKTRVSCGPRGDRPSADTR